MLLSSLEPRTAGAAATQRRANGHLAKVQIDFYVAASVATRDGVPTRRQTASTLPGQPLTMTSQPPSASRPAPLSLVTSYPLGSPFARLSRVSLFICSGRRSSASRATTFSLGCVFAHSQDAPTRVASLHDCESKSRFARLCTLAGVSRVREHPIIPRFYFPTAEFPACRWWFVEYCGSYTRTESN